MGIVAFMLVVTAEHPITNIPCEYSVGTLMQATYILYVHFCIFITVSNTIELALRRCRYHSKQDGKFSNCCSFSSPYNPLEIIF